MRQEHLALALGPKEATMQSPRERRLKYEFERMLAIRTGKGLIDFRCADLSAEEASAYLAASMKFDVVAEALPGFLTPEEFMRRFPGRAPEKYLIIFRCIGLMKTPEGEIVKTDKHLLEAVFGLDYPARPPRFVWLTPIWHPNIVPPYLCTEGRPFAIGTTLDQICLMVGQMIQYRNYNLDDPLGAQGKEVALWAAQNKHLFPVDTRGLLDGKEHSRPLVALVGGALVEWADELPTSEGSGEPGERLVEIL